MEARELEHQLRDGVSALGDTILPPSGSMSREISAVADYCMAGFCVGKVIVFWHGPHRCARLVSTTAVGGLLVSSFRKQCLRLSPAEVVGIDNSCSS